MGSVKKEDIPDVANFMPMLWELIKKYYIPENTDAYWDQCIAEANKSWESCHEDQLALYLLHGFFSYLETKQDGNHPKIKKIGGFI